jgi:hypothetical protein
MSTRNMIILLVFVTATILLFSPSTTSTELDDVEVPDFDIIVESETIFEEDGNEEYEALKQVGREAAAGRGLVAAARFVASRVKDRVKVELDEIRKWRGDVVGGKTAAREEEQVGMKSNLLGWDQVPRRYL